MSTAGGGGRRVAQSAHLIVTPTTTTTPDRIVRIALWCSVPLNLLGAAIFLSAAAGRPSSLMPLTLPPLYAAQLALVIGLFAGVYGWLAMQPRIDRPLLAVGAFGKLGFFAVFVVYGFVGDVGWDSVARVTPDLVLGLIFGWWLVAGAASPEGDHH